MDEHLKSRRRLLKQAAAVPIVVTLAAAQSGAARAGTAAKADFHYQDHPNEGHECASCAAFTAPPSGSADGSCSIVAGAVSPHGWCMAFSNK